MFKQGQRICTNGTVLTGKGYIPALTTGTVQQVLGDNKLVVLFDGYDSPDTVSSRACDSFEKDDDGMKPYLTWNVDCVCPEHVHNGTHPDLMYPAQNVDDKDDFVTVLHSTLGWRYINQANGWFCPECFYTYVKRKE